MDNKLDVRNCNSDPSLAINAGIASISLSTLVLPGMYSPEGRPKLRDLHTSKVYFVAGWACGHAAKDERHWDS